MEGDLIIDVITIDRGWIFGRVKRSGQSGLIPFNYLERKQVNSSYLNSREWLMPRKQKFVLYEALRGQVKDENVSLRLQNN